MLELQEQFNNREIAVGIWVLIAIVISIKTNVVRQFLKSVLPILFCYKFNVFYITFLTYFIIVVYNLYNVGFWDVSLLKSTIFWVLFVELPLFVETIKKATDNYFFTKLIKKNLELIIIIEFLLNFWTFGLITEFFIVPVSVIIGIFYAISSREKKYQQIKKIIDYIFIFFCLLVIRNTIINISQNPNELFNITVLKEFLLPIILLIFNLPIVYGLALYNTYEQVFIRVKGSKTEKVKIKKRIFRFAGINLSKINAFRKYSIQDLLTSLTEDDIKIFLDKLKKRLATQVGENYMKRTQFYIVWCVVIITICIIFLIWSNFQLPMKDIFNFNLASNIANIKKIITYICATGIATFSCLLLYSIGLNKKKHEEISLVKKFSLYNLFYLIKRQHNMLQEFPPIDIPKELFIQYITIAYELKSECDKTIALFENLLTTWELDTIKDLQLSIKILINSIGIAETAINQYAPDKFHSYFVNKKSLAPQDEKINLFINDVQNGIKEYSSQIKICFDEFKHYM